MWDNLLLKSASFVQQAPSAVYFEPGVAESLPRQPSHLIYCSFTTLTTVGFGDVHPVTPAARALTVAEALRGQLYIAILIASLVGMALQARSVEDEGLDKKVSTKLAAS